MENTAEEISFEMTDIILKIVGMIVTFLNAVVRTVELVDKYKHQKSNREYLPK